MDAREIAHVLIRQVMAVDVPLWLIDRPSTPAHAAVSG
jgi:hypothetical protein